MAAVKKRLYVIWGTQAGTWSGSTWATNINGNFILDSTNITRTADEAEVRDEYNDLVGIVFSGDRSEGSIEVTLSSTTSQATIAGVDVLPASGTILTVSSGDDGDYNGVSWIIMSATKSNSKGSVQKMTFNLKKSNTHDISATAS